MPELQELEELPFPESEVRSLIARVAARGASIAADLSSEAMRGEPSGHLIDEEMEVQPESTRHVHGADGSSWLRRGSVLRRRPFLIAALVVVLAAITAGALVESNRPAVRSMATARSSWRLASMVGQGVRPFIPTSANANSPADITCPAVTVCYVTSQSSVPGANSAEPNQISVTDSAYRSIDGGTTWQQLTLPPGVNLDTKFTCPSTDVCMVGSQVVNTGTINGDRDPQMLLMTTDGGATWSEENVPMAPITGDDTALDPSLTGLFGSLNELTCFSASTCLAFGMVPSDQQEEPSGDGTTVERTVFLRTDDGGATWTTYAFPWVANPDGSPAWSNAQAGSFACGSAEACVGFSTVLSATPNQVFSDLSWRTDDGGATWTQAWLPGVQPGLSANSISCPDPLHCVSIQRLANNGTQTIVAEVTSDGGITWNEESIPNEIGAELLSVGCADAEDCWLTGFSGSGNEVSDSSGVILESTDGGATWNAAQIPQGIGSVDDISCPASGRCFAIAGPSPASPTAANSQEILKNASST